MKGPRQKGSVGWTDIFIICFLLLGAMPGARAQDLIFNRQDLDRYVEKWSHADGDAASYISEYFLDFAVTSPEVFFAGMSKNPRVFDRWLEVFPGLVFTPGRKCLDLTCRLEGLKGAAKEMKVSASLKPYAARFLAALDAVDLKYLSETNGDDHGNSLGCGQRRMGGALRASNRVDPGQPRNDERSANDFRE